MIDAFSDVFEEAVRYRAGGIGLVPIGVIRRLTPEEWYKIRVMGQTEARRLVAICDAEPLVTVEPLEEVVDCGH